MTKRIFSILLALCMVFAFMPASAFAANPEVTLAAVDAEGNTVTEVHPGDKFNVVLHSVGFADKLIDSAGFAYTYDTTAFSAEIKKDTYEGFTSGSNDDNGTIKYLFYYKKDDVTPIENDLIAEFTVLDSATAGDKTFEITKASMYYSMNDEELVKTRGPALTIKVADKTEQAALNFTNADSVTYGNDLTLNAIGGRADAEVKYAITEDTDKIATLNGNKLTFAKAGAIKVTATKAGNAEYKEATATQTITVNKAEVTVTAKDRNIKVGETAPVLDKVKDTDYTVAGLVGNDELTDVTLSYASTPDTTKAGSVDINVTATADNAKYTVKTVKGTLTISDKTAQTGFDFANAKTTTYGKTLKLDAKGGAGTGAVTYEITGGMDVADLAADGTLTFKKAGEVIVKATKAADAEYAEATATQTITVNKADVTVTAKDRTIKVKETAPVLGKVKDTDYTVAGLVGNDELTDVTLSYASTPDTTKAGSVDINVTATADNAKYTVKTVKGKLTISDASTGGGGGGIIIPPIVQNPEIKLVEATMGKAELSADGTTATITPNDGYEIDKVTVNDKEVTITDNKITGLKAGDKVVVTFKAKAAPEPAFDVQKYVSDLKLVARSTKTAKGNIKVAVKTVTDQNGTAVNLSDLKDKGYTVKYKFYRSNKKASKYAAKTEKTIDKNSYVNTTGKKGTKYFYKVRVMVYDNDGKLVAKSELKQCKYASRTWTKK